MSDLVWVDREDRNANFTTHYVLRYNVYGSTMCGLAPSRGTTQYPALNTKYCKRCLARAAKMERDAKK